jgi:hypothetical protein
MELSMEKIKKIGFAKFIRIFYFFIDKIFHEIKIIL